MNIKGRYELKYLINSAQKARFLEVAQHGLMADPHGQDAIYRVSSVYFDTHDFLAYWEKMDGEAIRRKYRLRYYSIDEAKNNEHRAEIDAAFMEIKHRINNTVYKQRLRLTSDGAYSILSDARQLGNIDGFLMEPETADQSAITDIRRAARRGLEAKATITYLREAWLGKVDNRLRVTFDSRGQAYPASQFANVGSNTGDPFMPANQIVMEIKFDRSIPRWIRDILNRDQLFLQRFSKYAAGVESQAIRAQSQQFGVIPAIQSPLSGLPDASSSPLVD